MEREVLDELSRIEERLAGLIHQSEGRVMGRVDAMDTRINGRVQRTEQGLTDVEVKIAKAEGAVDALRTDLDRRRPSAHGEAIVTEDPTPAGRAWDTRVVAILGGLALLIGALAPLLTGGH